jgi:carbonic anhydrase
MENLNGLLSRNREFVSRGFNPNLSMMSASKSLIICCVDPRVDPMDIFKLEPGEFAVIRNIGGRLNPSLLETLKLLRAVTLAAGRQIGYGSNLILLHHTDCGINHCYKHAPELLAQHMGVRLQELDARAISKPNKSVEFDVAELKANPDVSEGYTLSGLVYDVATGKVEVVVPPTLVT